VTRYPTVEETVAVHAKLIARFGGSGGVRDRAALESALARPRSGYYSDLIQEAAALWERPSRPGEFHPEPLTDPCLSLSTHTARATH
jgi:death-on-curing protein